MFFFQAEDGIRDIGVTGVQTCALPILEASETGAREKDAQIANLGNRLNAALAARVEELQRYRSDFFGRLRDLLGERPEVRVVGDRFVFQSEVLFPPASADLSDRGQQQIRAIAKLFQELVSRFPDRKSTRLNSSHA